MEDLIKRSDATEMVYKALRTPPLKGALTDTMSLAVALVQDIPSADRPQGEWKEMYRNGFGNMICMCSKCNFHATKSIFCPNCGARMKGADDE